MDLSVHVEGVDGTQMAARITGTFGLDGETYRFTAIAFGRIGGQNVGAQLDEETRGALRGAGHDPEEVAMALQQALLQGDMSVPDNLKKESFLD